MIIFYVNPLVITKKILVEITQKKKGLKPTNAKQTKPPK